MGYSFVVWQSVTVTDQDHPRAGQAGTVQENAREGASTVKVKFDVDGSIEAVKVEALQVLR